MIEINGNQFGGLLALWGAVVSSGLAGIKIWETFWRDRIKIESTYSISYSPEWPHQITIANMSSIPVQVSSAELYWVPNFFPLKRRIPSIATPDYFYTTTFKIDGLFVPHLRLRWSRQVRCQPFHD